MACSVACAVGKLVRRDLDQQKGKNGIMVTMDVAQHPKAISMRLAPKTPRLVDSQDSQQLSNCRILSFSRACQATKSR